MKRNKMKVAGSVMLLFILLLGLNAGQKVQQIPEEYVGAWKSGSAKITVRKKTGWLKYQFIPANVVLSLNIEAANSVSGKIGDALFSNAPMTKNKGNPDETGIAYIIKCGSMDKLFATDSAGPKEIELWVKPLSQKGVMRAEIRLRDGWDTFPMGEGAFTRKVQ